MSKILEKRREIRRRLHQIDKLLAVESGVHPPGCNCAIKSHDEMHHDSSCPYRMLKELVPLLRAELSKTET
jgi:hypothetical protein